MLPLSARLAPARFLDPVLLVVLVLGVALYLSFRRTAPATPTLPRARRPRILAWSAWSTLWLLSTPLVASTLTGCTETRGPDLGAALAGKDPQKAALVVLGGVLRTSDESVPPRERLCAASTQRVLTASRLWHEHPFGLIVLTGAPPGETAAMLDLMTTLGVPPDSVVRETRALNTRENAIYTAEILRDRGAEVVVLVTSATHLRRAVKDFAAAGVSVIPAAAEIVGRSATTIDSFLPSASALAQTQVCLHEILGYLRG